MAGQTNSTAVELPFSLQPNYTSKPSIMEITSAFLSQSTTAEDGKKAGHFYVYSPATDRTIYTMLPGVVAQTDLETTFRSTSRHVGNNSNSNEINITDYSCDEMYQMFLTESNLFITRVRLVKIVLTWIIFFFSLIGNTFVLYSLTLGRKRRRMSHAQIMMFHLTCANLAFILIILPTDAIWNITVEWVAGEVLCRLTNLLKQFSMYISSAVIVVMGIDRAAGLMCQISTEKKRRRLKFMYRFAWIFSFVNAIPAAVFFGVIHYAPFNGTCPDHYFAQCVDYVLIDGPSRWPYLLYTWFISFFGPLICILMSYIFIAIAISRMARITKRSQNKFQSSTRKSLDRARRISQIVIALITATFVLCWGPYYVVAFIDWFWVREGNPHGSLLSPMVNVLMLMSMYLSPCLHPVITIILVKEVRTNIKTQISTSKSSIANTFRVSHSKNENVPMNQKRRPNHQYTGPVQKPRRTVVKKIAANNNEPEVMLMDNCMDNLLKRQH